MSARAMPRAERDRGPACTLVGLRRRGPRRDVITGMAITGGMSAKESLVMAAGIATVSGRPLRSDRVWIFESGLPRSTRLRPVRNPFFCPPSRSVYDHPRPVQQSLSAEFVEDRAVRVASQPALVHSDRDELVLRGEHSPWQTRLGSACCSPEELRDCLSDGVDTCIRISDALIAAR